MGGTIPAKQGEVIIDLMGIGRSYKNSGQEVKALKEVDLRRIYWYYRTICLR